MDAPSRMLHLVAVGLDDYADKRIRRLRCAVNDARALARVYEDGVAEAEREITLLVDAQATREAVMTVIGRDLCKKVERDDVVIVYFACHGSPEQLPLQNAGRYLIMHDTKQDAIYATGIDLDRDIVTWINRIEASLTMVILDTCFSGAGAGRTFPGPHLQAERERGGGLRGAATIQDLKLGDGRFVLAASKEDQLAEEDLAREHGVFTANLLDVLSEHARESQSNAVDIGWLYGELHARVQRDTKERQTPVFKGELSGARLPVPAK